MSNSNKTRIACLAVLFFLVTAGVSFSHILFEGSVDVEPSGFDERNILLYYGNGGAGPGDFGLTGLVDFYELQTRYNNSGCPTPYTDQWPNDLNDFRVIFLIMPGLNDDTGTYYFTSMQVNQTIDFLLNGGRLVVQGDHSGQFGVNTVNDLLTRLGLGIYQNSDNVFDDSDPPPTDITADQLTNGVSTLDMGGTGVSTFNLSGSAKSLVRDSVGNDVVAVDQIFGSPPRPGADVLVYGDTQVLDDYQLLDGDGDGPYDNFVFADNIGMCLAQEPIADANGPYVGYEGDAITFDGTGSYDPDWTITIYQVQHNGDYNPDPGSLDNLITEINARTSYIAVNGGFTTLTGAYSDADMLYISGHNPFSFSAAERAALKTYLESGGLLFSDDCSNYLDNQGFEASFRSEMQTIFGVTLTVLPNSHPVFSSFYNTGGTLPTEWNSEPLEGIDVGGRTAVIYSDNDYGCGWELSGSPTTNEKSFKMGVNFAVFAFLTGGSGLIYEWDFDNDGQYDDGTGPTPTFVFNDDFDGTIGLRVTDASGLTDTDTARVTIYNVDPTVENGLEERKVKEIPVPWQRWRMGVNGVVDIIFLDDVREPVAIVRDFVVLQREIELDNLTWVETQKLPWEPIDDPTVPFILGPNEEVSYFVPVTEDDRAVLVRYSVAWASTPDIIEAEFINEAILESKSPQVIVGSLSNFDVHNDYNETIDNFELELYGDIKPGYVLYGHDNVNHNIIQIDRTTGHATVVGPTGFISGASGMATSRGAVPGPGGATFPARTHFGLFRDNSLALDFVVVVDVSTGTATKVVQTSRLISGRGIAFGSDGVTLYVIEGTGALSTIDVVTGTVSLVGNTGHSFDNIQWDPSSWLFYGISGTTLYKINPGTAVATAVLLGGLAPGFSACTLTRSPVGVWYTVNAQAKTLVTININTGTISGVVGNLGPHASASVCGTVFELSDILYVYDPPGPPTLVPGWLGPTWYGGWGAPPVVIPLPGGVEIKWIDQDHPVVPCEWIHFGVALSPDVNLTGARAYLTQIVPVPMHVEEKKVKAIPVPWQKWRMAVNGVWDIIFFDPPAMPFDAVALVRDFAVLDYEIPLDDLTWVETEHLNWTQVEDPKNPYILNLNEEVELFIPTTEDDRAVLVRYSVAWAHTPTVIESHFINEAILESKSPQTIVGQLSNFDVHNDYNDTIDNFELEFYGNVVPSDVLYVYDPSGPPVLVPGWLGPTWYGGWGAPPLINPIPGGIEIKWIDLDHPVQYCEWIHFGVAINTRPDLNMTGAKAYLTQMVPELKEVKVKAIPVPWQKWRMEVNGVTDIIFFDPPGMPFDAVALVRDFVVLDYEIPLDDLTWVGTEGLNWTPVDDPKNPYILNLNEEVELFIPVTADDTAVLVRYSVAWANTPSIIEAHFVNEAVLESRSPPVIVGWLSNFDVHNDYNETINNFELEFYGNITPSDILYVYDPPGPPILFPGWLGPTWYNGWGAPPLINSIPGGLEIKWVDLDHPVPYCEWIHFGVSLRPDVFLTGAKAYLTQMLQVPVYTVDEGSPVTLIAYATDPGSDDLTFTWSWGDGTPDTVTTYFNNGASPDPYPSYWYGTYPFSATDVARHVYPDDGHYNVTLTVTDDDGGEAVSHKQVIVKNVPPTVDIDYTVYVNEPRTVGYWGHQCTVETPYGDHTGILQEWIDAISNQSLVFSGISTKQQVCDIVQETDRNDMLIMAKRQLMAVWLNLVSGKLDPLTPVNLPSLTNSTTVMQAILEMENILLTTTDRDEQERAKDIADNINNGIGIALAFGEFIGTATDPGADDLLFVWDFDDGTTLTTFHPNPGGVFPFTVVETVWHTFPGSGTYIVTLTVTDDNGGVGVATAVVVIP